MKSNSNQKLLPDNMNLKFPGQKIITKYDDASYASIFNVILLFKTLKNKI